MKKNKLTLSDESNQNGGLVKAKKTKFSPSFFAFPWALISVIFVILPLALVFIYAFISDTTGGFTFENFKAVFTSDNLLLLIKTVGIALLTTLLCLVIAYPTALILASKPFNKYVILALLFIIPMWMNFVLRELALRDLLLIIGIEKGLGATLIGMVYDFLPFMLLPIYTVLTEMDQSYGEASADLGANGFVTLIKVTLPLSAKGIVSGITMVFMPVFSAYAITDMLGDNSTTIIGKTINELFLNGSTWGLGSAYSFVLLVLVFAVMGLSSLFGRERKPKSIKGEGR